METGQNWWVAGDLEYRFRTWVIAAIFFSSFQLYWWDHVSAATAVATWLAHGHGDGRAVSRLVLGVGAVAVVAAAMLRTWAAAYLRSDVVHDPRVRDARLVADGPYRYVRNPLYLGTLLMAFGIGLAASRSGFMMLMAGILLFQYRLTRREERALMATQGSGYSAYLAAVPRLWPSLRPRVAAGCLTPHWRQAMRGELFMWGFAAIFALFALTENAHLLIYGCVAVTAVLLLKRPRRAAVESEV